MPATHSHLLPISSHQEHRAFCLRCLAKLAHKPAESVTPSSIDRGNCQARLNFYRFYPFQGMLRALWKVAIPIIGEKFTLGFNLFFDDHQTCISNKLNTTVSLNKHHSHLIYGSQYPLKWREPVKIQVYRQLPWSIIDRLRASSAKQRRQKARYS